MRRVDAAPATSSKKEYAKALRNVKQFKGRVIEEKDHVEFINSIYTATARGLTLHSIVHTSFLDEHLQRLGLHQPPPATTLHDGLDLDLDIFDDDFDLNLDEMTFDMDLDDDTDEEFPAGDLSDPSIWRTYGKRLHGLVSHFEAAKNLIKHPFKSGDQKLSLRVHALAFRRPPNSIIASEDWKEILRGVVSLPNNPPPYDINNAFTKIHSLMPRGVKFGGSQHCEASLAAMATTDDLPVQVIFTMSFYIS
jgi:hypothetical protein